MCLLEFVVTVKTLVADLTYCNCQSCLPEDAYKLAEWEHLNHFGRHLNQPAHPRDHADWGSEEAAGAQGTRLPISEPPAAGTLQIGIVDRLFAGLPCV